MVISDKKWKRVLISDKDLRYNTKEEHEFDSLNNGYETKSKSVPDLVIDSKSSESIYSIDDEYGGYIEMYCNSSNDNTTSPIARNDNFEEPDIIILESSSDYYKIFTFLLSLISYFALSIAVSCVIKYILDEKYVNFPFPLLLTSSISLFHSILSTILIWCYYTEPRTRFTHLICDSTKHYFRKVLPCGIAGSIEIGLSNLSFIFVALSLYTMIKSSSPIFILLTSFAFGLEKPKLNLIVIIIIIASGIMLAAIPPNYADNQMDIDSDQKVYDSIIGANQTSKTKNYKAFSNESRLFGIFLVLAASAFSGLRWVLVQILMTSPSTAEPNQRLVIELNLDETYSPDRKKHETIKQLVYPSLKTCFQVSPIVFIISLLLSVILDDWSNIPSSPFFSSIGAFCKTFISYILLSLLCFALVISEYLIMKLTSAVTMSVAGICKEILMIMVSIVFFGDVLIWINYIGLMVSLLGIGLYHYMKMAIKIL